MEQTIKKYKELFVFLKKNKIKYGIRKATIEAYVPKIAVKEIMEIMQKRNILKPYGSTWALTKEALLHIADCNNNMEIEIDELAHIKTPLSGIIAIYQPLFDHIKSTKQQYIGRKEAHNILKNMKDIPDNLMEELEEAGALQKHNSTWKLTPHAMVAIGMETKVKSISQHVKDGTMIEAMQKERTYAPANWRGEIEAFKKLDLRPEKKKSTKVKKEYPKYCLDWMKIYKANKKFQAFFKKQYPEFQLTDLYDSTPNDFIGNGIYASWLSEYNKHKK